MSLPKESEEKLTSQEFDIENQIVIGPDQEGGLVILFEPVLTSRIVTHRVGEKHFVRYPSPEKIDDIEERELISIDPKSRLRLYIYPSNVVFETEGLIYRNREAKESRAFLIQRADDGEKIKLDLTKWLEIIASEIEKNLKDGETPKSEATLKVVKRLTEVLKQEDWSGDYCDADAYSLLSFSPSYY